MPVFKKSIKKRDDAPAAPAAGANDEFGTQPVKQLDTRMGLDCYRDFYTLKNYWKTVNRRWKECEAIFMHRELFTLKNYWKTVRRNDLVCAKTMLCKYLKSCTEAKERYPKLSGLSMEQMMECPDPAFEGIASNYLKVFDDVITSVEQTPSDATAACQRLASVGKMHRSKVSGMKFDDFQQLEAPFLYMIGEVLQDRFNEKAEMLFRKFFQFCLRFILEGFNS